MVYISTFQDFWPSGRIKGASENKFLNILVARFPCKLDSVVIPLPVPVRVKVPVLVSVRVPVLMPVCVPDPVSICARARFHTGKFRF